LILKVPKEKILTMGGEDFEKVNKLCKEKLVGSVITSSTG
jgi:hypothetical protein